MLAIVNVLKNIDYETLKNCRLYGTIGGEKWQLRELPSLRCISSPPVEEAALLSASTHIGTIRRERTTTKHHVGFTNASGARSSPSN
jgi:hypothetical protein